MYSVRSGAALGFMPSNDQYGGITQGNLTDSFGPWVDPELQRMPHRLARRTPLNLTHGHRKGRRFNRGRRGG